MMCINKEYIDDSFIHCSTQGGGCTDDRDMDIGLFTDDYNTDDSLELIMLTTMDRDISTDSETLHMRHCHI